MIMQLIVWQFAKCHRHPHAVMFIVVVVFPYRLPQGNPIFLTACRKEILLSLSLSARKPNLVFPYSSPTLTV